MDNVVEQGGISREELNHEEFIFAAGLGKRFINSLIDNICFSLFSSLIWQILIILGLYSVLGTMDNAIIMVLIIVFQLLFYFVYFILFEYQFGVTPGKIVTKTKVLTDDNRKPSLKNIIIRTLCRLIPLEAISFLACTAGWHDSFSKTQVVLDTDERDIKKPLILTVIIVVLGGICYINSK